MAKPSPSGRQYRTSPRSRGITPFDLHGAAEWRPPIDHKLCLRRTRSNLQFPRNFCARPRTDRPAAVHEPDPKAAARPYRNEAAKALDDLLIDHVELPSEK